MKKSIFFAALVATIFTSCSVFPKYPYVQESSMLDYSGYTSKGFFLTESNSVNFDYKAIGSVSAKVIDGYVVKGVKQKSVPNDDVYSSNVKTFSKKKYGEFKKAYPEDALNEICETAMNKGANGIINLKTEPITMTTQNSSMVIGYFITGMAIKK